MDSSSSRSVCFLGALLVSSVSFAATQSETQTVSGVVQMERGTSAQVRVFVVPLQTLSNGAVQRPSKQTIFAGSQLPQTVVANGSYSLQLKPGSYCVFAFDDQNKNKRWDPATPEAFGSYANKPGGRFDVVRVGDANINGINIVLRAPQHFPADTQSIAGGNLTRIKGIPVLQLVGDSRARGFAHGRLVAPQIVDFFRFYVLEDKLRSAKLYESGFAKFLHSNFAYPKTFVTECKAVVEGMRASGADLMIPELDREFNLTDLYAINGYIETRAMRESCTQFAAWGSRTESTDVNGGMVTGRNMDGEIDIRRVTVSHFLIFAVDPSESNQKRFVSMMWPGFVATISGMNEDGFYTMENAGLTGPGKVVDKLVPISWTMRETLAKLGADTTPATLQSFVDGYDNSAGGISGPGCIMLFATPFRGQKHPAFVFEGDRFGDAIRTAGEVRPRIPNVLVCSNHHRKYGVGPGQPGLVFGRKPSYSSLWRYEAGMHKLEGWHRSNRKIGTPEMRELLQVVAHGTTEYSVITRPNKVEFDVAVASMDPELWDAPYREWTRFRFDEVFSRK